MTGAYERELREVLAGTEKGVHAVTKSCSPEEKKRMSRVIERPFLVVRAAGSGTVSYTHLTLPTSNGV